MDLPESSISPLSPPFPTDHLDIAFNSTAMNNSNEFDYMSYNESIPFFRLDTSIVLILSISYVTLFCFGILGNTFVVLAVLFHKQLRTTTDYLISSLAMADLLILLFCLPTTLVNNVLTDWPFGSLFCKLSIWINTTTSFSSIYTLVAVTADRYFAICHTLKYALWDSSYTFYVIAAIWLVSGASWLNVFYRYDTEEVPYLDGFMIVCVPENLDGAKTQFLVLLCLGLAVPLILISVCYTLIFITVSTHRSLAVDAHIRDERVKLRVATMMLTVIVVFTLCWVPLYVLYIFITFFIDQTSEYFYYAHLIRPIFQWLSLLSSTLNPLIYITYSHKYRRAFHRILLAPFRKKYERVRGTLIRSKHSIVSNKHSTAHVTSSFGLNTSSVAISKSPTETPAKQSTTNAAANLIKAPVRSRTSNSIC